MKLLILSQYYPPETGAPQNRLHELAVRLRKAGVDVSVLTAMPNYPRMVVHEGYRGKLYLEEEIEGIAVHRSYIFTSTSNKVISRLFNYFSFVLSSFLYASIRLKRSDYIFCESPPLFLGITAFLLSKMKGAKLIFNVSDLWPESAEKLGIVTNKFLLKSAGKLEEFLYRNSALITGQTQGIVNNIAMRIKDKDVYWLPNSVDLSFFNPDKYDRSWRVKYGYQGNELIFAYAGILGYAQGLEVIVKAAALLKNEEKVKFILLGSGPQKETLVNLNKALGNSNLQFIDLITKEEMPFFLSAIDVAIIPLKGIPLFRGAIPSKIFENLSMKKPILLGVEGEAHDLFIRDAGAGLSFRPDDEADLSAAIQKFIGDRSLITSCGEKGRKYVEANFDRNNIASKFLAHLSKQE